MNLSVNPTNAIPSNHGTWNGINNTLKAIKYPSGIDYIRDWLDPRNWKDGEHQFPSLEGRVTVKKNTGILALIRKYLNFALVREWEECEENEKPIDATEGYFPYPVVSWDFYFPVCKFIRLTLMTDPAMIRRTLKHNRNLDRCPFTGGAPFERTRRLIDWNESEGKQLFSTRNNEYLDLRHFLRAALSKNSLLEMPLLASQLRTHSVEVIHILKEAPEGVIDDLASQVIMLPSKVIQSLLFGKEIPGVVEAFWELLPYIIKDISNGQRLWPPVSWIKGTKEYLFLRSLALAVCEQPQEYPGLLSKMIHRENQDGKPLFDQEHVFSNMMLLLEAGQDTLMTAISNAIYALAKNPDKQETLYKALSEHFDNENILLEQIDNIPYLEWVVKEILRLYPSAPILVREINPLREHSDKPVIIQDSKQCAYEPSAEGQLYLNLYEANRHPDAWKIEPHSFIPERFDCSMKEEYGTDEKAWLPFSFGPNSCIGKDLAMLELKTFLFYAMKSGITFHSDQTLVFDYKITLSPKTPMMMKIEQRHT